MSHVIRKPAFCICENKGADQLHGSGAADQQLRFHYTDCTIPLLPKSKLPYSVVVQPSFVSNLVGHPDNRFSCDAAHMKDQD